VDDKNTDDLIILGHTANLHRHGSRLTSKLTSVLLIWPRCYTIHLMLKANFSISLVHDITARPARPYHHVSSVLSVESDVDNLPFRAHRMLSRQVLCVLADTQRWRVARGCVMQY
jgi:hypothetical protein